MKLQAFHIKSKKVKKELNLQTLINLKPTIEKLIDASFKTIVSNNAVLKKHKGEKIDTAGEYKKLRKLYSQLQIVKIAMFTANKKKNSLGISNQEAIFEKSDLERELSLLQTLSNQKLTRRDGSKEDAYIFTIDKSFIADRITEIEKRISEIQTALTNFNQSTTIKVVLDEDLDLLSTG